MKMEFGEDAENAEPSEEVGLAARLTKKTKTQAKEKGKKMTEMTHENSNWPNLIWWWVLFLVYSHFYHVCFFFIAQIQLIFHSFKKYAARLFVE